MPSHEHLETYLNSEYLGNLFQEACAIGKKEIEPPIGPTQAMPLRNCLISNLIIKNIRRSMELAEFTLREFNNVITLTKNEKTYYLCYIKEHKTGAKSKLI